MVLRHFEPRLLLPPAKNLFCEQGKNCFPNPFFPSRKKIFISPLMFACFRNDKKSLAARKTRGGNFSASRSFFIPVYHLTNKEYFRLINSAIL